MWFEGFGVGRGLFWEGRKGKGRGQVLQRDGGGRQTAGDEKQ